MVFFFLSDVQKMEKEQEAERERDRARSTKFFDPKFNEPPPKVRTRQLCALASCACFKTSFFGCFSFFILTAAFEDEAGPFREHAQHRPAHTGAVTSKWHFLFALQGARLSGT